MPPNSIYENTREEESESANSALHPKCPFEVSAEECSFFSSTIFKCSRALGGQRVKNSSGLENSFTKGLTGFIFSKLKGIFLLKMDDLPFIASID